MSGASASPVAAATMRPRKDEMRCTPALTNWQRQTWWTDSRCHRGFAGEAHHLPGHGARADLGDTVERINCRAARVGRSLTLRALRAVRSHAISSSLRRSDPGTVRFLVNGLVRRPSDKFPLTFRYASI